MLHQNKLLVNVLCVKYFSARNKIDCETRAICLSRILLI